MTTFPGSPAVLKGGIALIDADSWTIQRVIVLQYNPDTLTRTLQPKTVPTASEGGDRTEVMRLKGPPVETIKLEAEIDATDQLESGGATATRLGIHPQLAALELIVYPTSAQLQANYSQEQSGTLEIAPMLAPISLFIWSKNRILPVRLTEFSITEEAFDVSLNPIRAKVSLGLRVLSVDDFGFDQKGGSLFMIYQQQKEALAAKSQGGSLATLGLGGIP
jgi:hypothetical protein